MSKEINTIVALCDFNIINMVCNDIADNKTSREINELLIEEISELIKPVIKLQRWDNGETTLRYNIDEIYDNLYEELADVIIMMLQFIHKNNIEYEKLLNKMCKKLIRYYETKQE